MKNLLAILLTLVTLTACGPGFKASSPLSQPGVPAADGSVVVGRAIVQVSTPGEFLTMSGKMLRLFRELIEPMAYASSTPGRGSTTVTYTNAPTVTYTLNVSGLAPTFTPTFTSETLNLGSVTISALTDNNLKVCGSGSQKCTQSLIRVYTTGSTAGFLNTGDTYGTPVYAGTLNPTTQVGLTSAAAVVVQQFTIPASENKQHLTDFPSPTYAISSDFSNAGSGNYSMALVVEYVLTP